MEKIRISSGFTSEKYVSTFTTLNNDDSNFSAWFLCIHIEMMLGVVWLYNEYNVYSNLIPASGNHNSNSLSTINPPSAIVMRV